MKSRKSLETFFSSNCIIFVKSTYYTFWRNFSPFYRCWWTKQESYQGYPRPIWQNSPCCRSPTMRIQEIRRSRSQGQIPKVLPLRLYWLYFEFQLWCGNKNKSVWRKPTQCANWRIFLQLRFTGCPGSIFHSLRAYYAKSRLVRP